MKSLILCALFAPIVILALRQKKWYLYLLFAFIAVLPEQFSIKIHDSIPLLSATRILILIMTGFWLYDKWKTKTFRFPKSVILFFVVSLIVSLVNLRFGAQEIKRIFLLIFERVLLVIMIMDMIKDRGEFHRCIDFAIMGCVTLAVIGIVQTVFSYDISTALHLTKTVTSIQLSKRMDLVRAFGTYNAISFGCYCSVMALVILYRLYNTKSIWHSIAFALNFVALICTFTRSAWLCLAGVAFIILLVYRGKLITRMLPSVAMVMALLVTLCLFQPTLYKAFVETGKSSINTIINAVPDSVITLLIPNTNQSQTDPSATQPSQTLQTEPDQTLQTETDQSLQTEPEQTEPAPTEPSPSRPQFELDTNFGANASDPTYSRTAQWTAIEYMRQEGELLFGYGYNALPRGKIHFFFDRWAAKWQPTTFLDVGFVAMLTESGLVGTLAYLCLFANLFVYAFRKKSSLKKRELDFFWLTFFMIPLYMCLNYLASFPNAQAVWLFISMFYAYQKLDSLEAANNHANTKYWLVSFRKIDKPEA